MSAVMGMGTKTDIVTSSTLRPHDDNDDTPPPFVISKPLEPDYDVNVKGGEHSSERLHTGTWDWHSYVLNGVVQPKFQQACPNTAKILNDIQEHLFFDGGRNSTSADSDNHNPFGFAFFSTLHGKSYIKPHTGPMNLRLRIHLPLIVPKHVKPDAYSVNPVTKCGLRVGDQIRSWEEGKVIVLDDSYEHEVWNETEDVRVLLLVDVWHPDVRKVERERIGKMFGYAKSKGWIGGGGGGGGGEK
jgi:Aspartyl/asparaginyl beta-hydroxylase and related dioxygenases